MKKGKVRPLILQSPYLTTAEVAIVLCLLDKSDNADCVVPARFSPTAAELAGTAKVTGRTVRRALGHLALHGWIDYTPGVGRGRRGTYQVAPRVPDTTCRCRELKADMEAWNRGHQSPVKEDIGADVSAGQGAIVTGGTWRGKEEGGLLAECRTPEGTAGIVRTLHPEGLPTTPALNCLGSVAGEDYTLAPVVPLQRRRFASLSSPEADRLWCAGYDR